MRESFQIAIDGPVAAGKSTVAVKLAKKLGFVYVDTGAMYRAVALAAMRLGYRMDDEAMLADLVEKLEIDVRLPEANENDGRISTVLLNGEDVSLEIRSKLVSENVATVAALPRVREALVPKQQLIAEDRDVVMEGRDITYVVLPQADLKIFLTAQEGVRIQRYHEKMMTTNGGLTLEKAADMLKARDELDTNRVASPLKIVEGVWVLDTSEMTIEEVVETIARRVGEMRDDKKSETRS